MSTDFKTVEQAGWTAKAAAYDTLFAPVTRQAIAPSLDACDELDGASLLDVGCGNGDLAAAAAARGAAVTGVDFAATMIDIARANHPGIRFATGDAEALDLPDAGFDVVICAFGLWHIADPDAALAEFARVLRPGGRFVYTGWLPPRAGSDMMSILQSAIAAHGTLDVDLPAAPPPYRFGTRDSAAAGLRAAGFVDETFREERAVWRGAHGQELLDLIVKSVVRAPMLIDAQVPAARDAIRADIVRQANALARDGVIEIDWRYILGSARAPG